MGEPSVVSCPTARRPTFRTTAIFQRNQQTTNDQFSLTGESCDPFDRGLTQYCYALTCLRALSACSSFWEAYNIDDSNTHPVYDILDAVLNYRNNISVPLVSRLREWSVTEANNRFDGKNPQCAIDFLKRLLKDVQFAMKEFYKNIRTTIVGEAHCTACDEETTRIKFYILIEAAFDTPTIVDILEGLCPQTLNCRCDGCDGSGAALWDTVFGRLLIVSQEVAATGNPTVSYDIPQFDLVAVVDLLLNAAATERDFVRNTGHYVVGIKQPSDLWRWYDDDKEVGITSVWQSDTAFFKPRFVSQRILFYSRSPKFPISLRSNVSIFANTSRHRDVISVPSESTRSDISVPHHFIARNKTYVMKNKLYTCRACAYSASQSNNVQRHVKSHAKKGCKEHMAILAESIGS